MRGPIDFLIVGFEHNDFDGRILETLEKPIADGTIRLLGLAAISKDISGNITRLEAEELGDRIFIHFDQYHLEEDFVDEDDVMEVGSLLPAGTAAGVIFIEHLWAKPFKKALIEKEGFVIADGRIHPEAAKEID